MCSFSYQFSPVVSSSCLLASCSEISFITDCSSTLSFFFFYCFYSFFVVFPTNIFLLSVELHAFCGFILNDLREFVNYALTPSAIFLEVLQGGHFEFQDSSFLHYLEAHQGEFLSQGHMHKSVQTIQESFLSIQSANCSCLSFVP